jgi:hypothetical protein
MYKLTVVLSKNVILSSVIDFCVLSFLVDNHASSELAQFIRIRIAINEGDTAVVLIALNYRAVVLLMKMTR